VAAGPSRAKLQRMSLALRRAALLSSLAIALAACGGAGPAATGTRSAAQSAQPGGNPAPRRAPGPSRPMTFAPCPAAPCMLHAGRGRYHQCLHAGAGLCFHYGAPCAPADSCMLDAASAQYRKCQRVLGGECAEFGAACEPGGRCMLDPRDGVHRTCDQVSGGKCQRFAAPCTPKG
jgi:hypothetical protein